MSAAGGTLVRGRHVRHIGPVCVLQPLRFERRRQWPGVQNSQSSDIQGINMTAQTVERDGRPAMYRCVWVGRQLTSDRVAFIRCSVREVRTME